MRGPGFFSGQLTPIQIRHLRDRPNFDGAFDDVLPADLESVDQAHIARTLENIKPQHGNNEPAAMTVSGLKYSNFINIPLSIGLASTLVLERPQGDAVRVFWAVVNTHATQTLFVAFGQDSTALLGWPILGNFGYLGFDVTVPQDRTYLIASGAATTGVLLYSNKSPDAAIGA